MDASTEVGKIDNIWIAQTCFTIDVDDFAIIKMYFNKEPNQNDLETAFAIRAFELNPIEVFTCWECGNMVNWLELDGDIKNKLSRVKESYCGC